MKRTTAQPVEVRHNNNSQAGALAQSLGHRSGCLTPTKTFDRILVSAILLVVALIALAVIASEISQEDTRSSANDPAAPLADPWSAVSKARYDRRPRQWSSSRHFVLITIDTLRADHVGTLGYRRPTTPNIDRLAQDSLVFLQAISQAPWTRASMASVFTGLCPGTVGVTGHNFEVPEAASDVLPDAATTLAEVLQDAGFATTSVVANVNVDPLFGFAQGFETVKVVPSQLAASDPDWRRNPERFNDTTPEVTEAALSWLQESGATADRFFLNLHYLDPHHPYSQPPIDGRRSFLHLFRDDAEARYDGEIRLVDGAVGKILAQLEALGLADDTATAVISDHGEEFLDHGGRYHGNTVFDEQIHVPFILRVPGLTDGGLRINEQVRLVDLFPTVLEALGVAAPAPLEGRSVLGVAWADSLDPAPALSEYGYRPLVSWRSPPWKLIVDLESGSQQLFHLVDDPDERHNLVDDFPLVAARLSDELVQARTSRPIIRRTAPSVDPILSPRQLAQLEALGYASTPAES